MTDISFDTIIWGNMLRDYLIFLGILLAVFLLKRLGFKLLVSILKKLSGRYSGFVRLIELIDFIKRPLEMIIIVLIIYAGFLTFSAPETVIEHPVFVIAKRAIEIILQLMLVISVIWLIFKTADYIALRISRKAHEAEEINKVVTQSIPFIRDITKILLILMASVFVFGVVFGFNVTSLLAGLGIGGLAIAFAAQETLANLLASFTIFIDKPFRVGDFIQVGDIIGTVESVGFRSTRIRTLEKSYLSVPNKQLVDSTVDNLTLRTNRRARFNVGLTYQTTPAQIKAIVTDIKAYLDQHSRTTEDSVVGFHEFSDSSLDIVVNFFMDTMDWATYISIRQEVNLAIMEIVEKNGSSIAYPTRTVHLFDEKKEIASEKGTSKP